MKRNEIVSKIGSEYLTSNIENDEYSYQKGLSKIGKNYLDYLKNNSSRKYKDVDIRFQDDNFTILIETKSKIEKSKLKDYMEQLQQYVIYEEQLSNNKILAILASTNSNDILVWDDGTNIIAEENVNKKETILRSMYEYKSIYFSSKNDKIAVMQNTYKLNEILHGYGIKEKIRSQFVGTCLLALKNGVKYENLSNAQIRGGIEGVLDKLLDNLNKAEKLLILKKKVIDTQNIRDLKDEEFQYVLRFIENNIVPYINEKSNQG